VCFGDFIVRYGHICMCVLNVMFLLVFLFERFEWNCRVLLYINHLSMNMLFSLDFDDGNSDSKIVHILIIMHQIYVY